MNKVLIITYYWPPSGSSGVQRILKFTKYLPQFGWQPIILTVNKYPLVNEGDQMIQIADINFSEKEVDQFKPWNVEKDESIS